MDLVIEWQRLVDEKGRTCDRCRATGIEVQTAFSKLKESLAPLGIEVVIEERALEPATVAEDVSRSNLILVAGRPLEEWLGAEVGKSHCGSCCEELGESVECRTLELEGRIYETIPAGLIIRAGLQAASAMAPCCGPGASSCCGSHEKCCGSD